MDNYFNCILTEQDKENLIKILNVTPITGLANARAVVELADKIADAPEAAKVESD